MRFVVSSNRMRCLNQVAAIGILAIFGAGCSSDFARFDAAEYTASIKADPNQAPQANPYPADVDPVTTASVARSAVNRPPPPLSSVNNTRPVAPAANNPVYRAPAPVVRQQDVVPKPTYNTYNTYNTYQAKPVVKQPKVKRDSIVSRLKSRAAKRRTNVDPVTTSAIKPVNLAPARPALARPELKAPTVSRTALTKPALVKPIAAPVVLTKPKPIVAAVPQKPAVQASTNNRPSGWTSVGGTAITVRDGENLYNISKRYGVPVNALKRVNNISDVAQVNAGQRIIIPTYVYSSTVPVSAPDNNPKTRASRASKGYLGETRTGNVIVPTRAPKHASSGYKPGLAAIELPKKRASKPTASVNQYKVSSGDSLGAIAQKHGVSVKDLMRENRLTSSNIRLGQTLQIPVKSAVKPTTSNKKVVGLAPMGTDKVVTGATPKPYTKPGKKSSPKVIDAKAPARTGIDTFRWPVTGKVFSKFGDRRSSGRNDGIDISVPVGTSVKAAENGVVIYSGSELQDYGNLLLVRHDGGWVSAYAHNQVLKVKRGEKVRRGQVIAKSGRTGSAERPMMHFELRKDSNPVNPQKYLR